MSQEITFSMTTKAGETISIREGDAAGSVYLFITTPPATASSGTLAPDEIDVFLKGMAQVAAKLRVKAARPPNAEPIAKT